MTLRRLALGTSGLLCLVCGCPVAFAGVALPGVTQPTQAPRATAAPAPQLETPPIKSNGIAAIVENKVITMDEVQQQLNFQLQGIRERVIAAGGTQKTFEDAVDKAIDEIIQSFIDRELVIKEFRKVKTGQPVRQIPVTFIDARISAMIATDFDNDRSRYVKYLADRQITQTEHRQEVEEEIIFQYMRNQQRHSMSMVSPVKIETYYKENLERFKVEDKAHMRLLQLRRNEGETDAQLRARLDAIVKRVRAGESFKDITQAESQDPSSKSKGGDYGLQVRSDLKEEFSGPLFNLKKGEVTDPIVSGDNGFLLYAEERVYAGTMTLETARPAIENLLVQQMGAQEEQRWLERLRRAGFYKLLY